MHDSQSMKLSVVDIANGEIHCPEAILFHTKKKIYMEKDNYKIRILV